MKLILTDAVKKAKDAIAAPYLARNPSSSSTNNRLSNCSDGVLSNNPFNARVILSAEGGSILMRMMPQYFSGGYINMLEKWTSCVISALFSARADCIISPFLAPDATRLTSWPDSARNISTSERTFSSIRNFILSGRRDRAVFFGSYQFGRKVESGFDEIPGKRGIAFENLFNRFSGLKKFKDNIYHYTRSFETRLAMANIGIGSNVIFNIHSNPSLYYKSIKQAGVGSRENYQLQG